MLYVLDHIEEKYGKSPFDECDFIALLSFPNMVKTVTYSLADEIYVKRDGHGPLSYSENLKSWMEEKIISHFEDDPNFIEDWQKKWADFFCANHDKSQDHPEEIPTLPKADEQELFFRNLLRIFWTKNNNTFVPNENRELLYNELDIDVNKKLEDEIVARMKKSELSLFVFEKTNLFSKEFFTWAKKALDGISELSQQINTCSIEFDLSTGDKKKTLCNEIFFGDINRKLVIMSGIIDYCIECNNSDFYEWLRFIRNVVCNINDVVPDDEYRGFNIIDFSDYENLIANIEKIAQETKDKNSVLEVLVTIDPQNYRGIEEEILEEEKIKAALLLKAPDKWETRIKEIENNRYFTGKIKFMFDFLGKEPDAEKFDSYASLMNKLFSDEKGGDFNSEEKMDSYFNSKINKALFSRALLCFPKENVTKIDEYGYLDNYSNWFALEESKMWRTRFDHSWKRFINDSGKNNIIKQLLEELIHKHNSSLCDATLKTIINEHRGSITDWRSFFIKYEKLWQEGNKTEQRGRRWFGQYNILVKRHIRRFDNVDTELRTYCLYLDYERENPLEKKGEWEFKCYGYNIEFKKERAGKIIVISVSFDAENATSEDFYQLDIFLRDKEGENTFDHSKEYLKKYYDGELHALGYSESEQGYSISKKSKEAIKQEIERLLNIPFA